MTLIVTVVVSQETYSKAPGGNGFSVAPMYDIRDRLLVESRVTGLLILSVARSEMEPKKVAYSMRVFEKAIEKRMVLNL